MCKNQPLDNYAGFASIKGRQRVAGKAVSPEADQRKRDRTAIHNAVRPWTSKERLRQCGHYKRPMQGHVEYRWHEETGSKHFHGLVRCGYAQMCPSCAAKIANERSQEIGRAVDAALKRGHGVYMLTLTVPHHRGHRLNDLRRLVERAFRHMTGGRAWQSDKADFLILGHIKTHETTIGVDLNGWHPHLHILLFTDSPIEHPELLHERLFSRWQRFVEREGYDRPQDAGTRMDPITTNAGVGRYLSKVAQGIGNEMARSDLKQGRKEHWTHWQLLRIACETEERQYMNLWHEWEESMSGVRLVTWSRGLKDYFGIDELADEEIAEREESYTHSRTLTDQEWQHLKRNENHLHLLYAVTDTHGAEGVDAFLSWMLDSKKDRPRILVE